MSNNQSRSKKFFYNVVFTTVLQLFTIISGFVIPRIILRYYGSEINGLISSITQFISYFNLVEAGLSSAAIYALYKPLSNGNQEEISAIVSASKKLYLQSGYIFTGLTIILALIYPFYIETSQLPKFLVGLLVVVLGSNGFLEFFTLAKYRVLLAADQKTYVISIASCFQVVLQMVILLVLSPFEINVVLIYTFAILSIFTRSLILYIYCKRNYKNINYKAEPNTQALNKRWDALFSQILAAVHRGAPVVLLTIIVKDLTLVSVYSVYHVVVGGLNSLLGIFNSGLSSSFGEVIVRKEKQTLQKAYKEFEFLFYSLECILFSVAFIMIMPFVSLYTSDILDANYNMPVVAFLMLIDGFLYQLKTPQNMLVYAAGLYKETKWRAFTQGMIVLVGGAILAIPFGIYGILIASILSNFYRVIDLFVFSNKYITALSPKNSLYNALLIIAEMVIIILPTTVVDLSCLSWGKWIVKAICCSAFSIIVVSLFSIAFRRNYVKNVISRIKYIIKK